MALNYQENLKKLLNPNERAKKYIEEQTAKKEQNTTTVHPVTKENAQKELRNRFSIVEDRAKNGEPLILPKASSEHYGTQQSQTALQKSMPSATIGEASQNAIRQKEWEEQFKKPEVQELVKKANDSFTIPGRKRMTIEDLFPESQERSFLGSNVLAGALGTVRGYMSTLDMVLPEAVKRNGLQDVFDFYKALDDKSQAVTSMSNSSKGKAYEYGGKFVQVVTRMVPDTMIAVLSGGASKAVPAAKSGAKFLSSALKGYAKNPSFWNSIAGTLGVSYEEAKAEGASHGEAVATAVISSLLSAGIESRTGIESIPQKPKGILGWVKSALEEGGEEVVQGVIENLTAKSIYHNDAPWVSMSDNNAVINPLRMAEEFSMGTLAGGFMGAPYMAVESLGKRAPKSKNITFEDIVNYKPREVGAVQQDVPSSADVEPILVGRVTKIYRPYRGAVPTQDNFSGERQIIPDKFLQNAQKTITAATNTETKKVDKSWVRQTFQQIFDAQGGQKQVPVQGVTMDGEPYIVSVGRKVVGKVISDPNLTAEKLAILENVDSVIANAEFVGSGEYVQKGTKEKNVTRYDYFETPVSIGGQDYVASFDVEVYPNTNNYRTHKVINEMDLIPVSTADVGPEPTAAEMVSSPSGNSIPQNAEKSNKNILGVEESGEGILNPSTASGPLPLTLKGTRGEGGVGGEVTTPQSAQQTAPFTQGDLMGENLAEGSDTSSTASGPPSPQGEGVRRSKLGNAKAVADILSSAYGVKFAEYSAEDGVNGYYDPETRAIYINQESDEPVLATISHELLHDLKVNDTGAFYTLRQIVNQDMNLTSFEAYKESLLAAYDAIGKDYSGMTETELYEQVLEEAMADLCAEVMRDPNTITRIAKADRNLAQRIVDKLSEILETIRRTFREYFGGETAEIRSLVNHFTEVKSIYQSVLENTAKKGSVSEGTEGEIKTSVSRKVRAEDAIQKYKETGDERDLPDRGWARGFSRDTQNRSRYLENQLQDLEYQLAFADEASREAIEGSISKLREKIQEAAKNREVAIELNDVLDNTTLNRNIDLAPVIGDLNDVDTGLKVKNGNYRFNDFFRNMERFFGKHFHLVKPLVDGFDSAKGDFARMQVERNADMKQYIVKELGIKPGSKESKAVQWIGEGKRNPLTKEEIQQIDAIVREQASAKGLSKKQTSELKKTLRVDYTEDMLRREFGDETAERILAAERWFRKQYDELIDEINRTQRLIYPNRPDKQIPRRKDYMRHFRELNTGFRGLANIFGVDNNIAPELVLVSDHTKPKEKWASIKQEREGGATDEGAIEGFLDYLPQAAYAIHLNPYIDKFRGLARDIADLKAETGDTGANGFIKYLNEFASHIAGKSDPLDRVILDKLGSNGRTLIKTLNWLNNRVKSNAVLGNIGSVTKQVMNIPNGMELLHNPAGILQGIGDVIAGGKDAQENYKKSDFLTERFLDSSYSQFEKNGLKKSAQWLLSAADEFGTRAIWNAAYREGVRLSKAGEITETPERYADILTRRAVAGRGVGEVPLAYQSQVGKLIMPFQIEVSNTWNVHRDVLSGKAQSWGEKSSGLERGTRELIGYLAVWGLGAALEALTGSKGAFDPLGAILDGILQGKEEEKEGSTWDKILKMGQRSVQNVGGEFVGSRPMGWVLGEFLSLIDEDWATNLFNDSVYQSQGVNVPAVQSLSKSVKDFKDGDIVGGLAEFGSSFLTPFGGKQIDKTVRGLADFVHGGKYQNDVYKELSTGERGDKRYDIPKTAGNFAKSFLFGPSSLSVGQEYWDEKRQEGYAQTAKSSATNKAMKQFAKGYNKAHPDSEVERLYNEVKDFSVYPHSVISDVQKFTKDNKEIIFSLLPAEKEQYQKEQDRRMQAAYDEVINSKGYQSADTEGKMALLEDARKEAKKTVSDMILNDHLYKNNLPYGRFLSEGEHQKRTFKDSGTPEGLAAYSRASTLVSFATAAEKDGRMTQDGAKKLQAALGEKQAVTDLDRELYRLNELGVSCDVMYNAYNLFSFTKNKKDYRIKVPGDALADIFIDTEKRFRSAMDQAIGTAAYRDATVYEKRDILNDAKSDVRKVIREELKSRYGYELDDEFAKMARMK